MKDVFVTPPPDLGDDCYRAKKYVYAQTARADGTYERPPRYCIDPISNSLLIRCVLDTETQAWSTTDICKKVREVPVPTNGAVFDFCLRASPMRKLGNGYAPDEPDDWLRFITPRIGVRFVKHFAMSASRFCGKARGFYLPETTYVGELVVEDERKLTHVLSHGVGRHKAFGFGVMQLI
jgi:hypothetical protein